MGAAYVILSLHVFVAYTHEAFFFSVTNTVAIDIFFFFPVIICFRHAFLHLLDHSYSDRHRLMEDGLQWAVVAFVCIVSLLTKQVLIRRLCAVAAIVMLAIYTLLFVKDFLQLFKEMRMKLENYYVEQMDNFVRWIRNSVMMLFIYGYVILATLYMPIEVKLVCMVAAIIMNLYIALSFQNYMRVYDQLERSFLEKIRQVNAIRQEWAKVAATADDDPTDDSDHTRTLDETQESLLRIWIASQRYCEPGLTLDMLAQEINTNRTYLSQYINETYQESFSLWISRLRIEDAKRMLLEDQDRSMEDIAHSLGFSSGSYFNRVFSQIVGTTPARWQRDHTDQAHLQNARDIA